MNDIIKTADELMSARQEVDRLKELLVKAREKKDFIQADLMAKLSQNGLKSIKTENHSISRATKSDIRIVDHSALLEELRKRSNEPEWEECIREAVDTDLFKPRAKALFKTGELLAGTEPYETEYISIRTV